HARDLGLDGVELRSLLRDRAGGGHEGERREHGDRDDSSSEHEVVQSARTGTLLIQVAREEIDGSHQSSIPRPIAIANDPNWLSTETLGATFTRLSGSPRRIGTPTISRRASGSPSMCAVPPVTTISPMPRAPGWAW